MALPLPLPLPCFPQEEGGPKHQCAGGQVEEAGAALGADHSEGAALGRRGSTAVRTRQHGRAGAGLQLLLLVQQLAAGRRPSQPLLLPQAGCCAALCCP